MFQIGKLDHACQNRHSLESAVARVQRGPDGRRDRAIWMTVDEDITLDGLNSGSMVGCVGSPSTERGARGATAVRPVINFNVLITN